MKQSFEASLGALEKSCENSKTVISLEERLKLFEDGVKLSRECQERLNQSATAYRSLLKDANEFGIANLSPDDLPEERHPKVKKE